MEGLEQEGRGVGSGPAALCADDMLALQVLAQGRYTSRTRGCSNCPSAAAASTQVPLPRSRTTAASRWRVLRVRRCRQPGSRRTKWQSKPKHRGSLLILFFLACNLLLCCYCVAKYIMWYCTNGRWSILCFVSSRLLYLREQHTWRLPIPLYSVKLWSCSTDADRALSTVDR